MNDRVRGLYEKFVVTRTDGQSNDGEKHSGCEYFVLDLTHDPFAWPAIAAYCAACAEQYPALAADLLDVIRRHLSMLPGPSTTSPAPGPSTTLPAPDPLTRKQPRVPGDRLPLSLTDNNMPDPWADPT